MHRQASIWTALSLALSGVQAQTLSEAVSSQSNLSILGKLLAGVPETAEYLSSLQDITLFAPSDAAFQSLIDEGGIFSVNQVDDDPGLVEAILRYHTAQGAIMSSQIEEVPQWVPTFLNYTVFVQDNEVTGSNVTGGQVVGAQLDGGNVVLLSGLKDTSTVVTADLEFDNGIVHIIDTVLTIPMSVSSTLTYSNLTALTGALEATDLVATLEGLKDVTIFAPTNDAFQAIGGSLEGVSVEALADVLTYHVVSGTVGYSTELTSGTTLETVQGEDVTITIEDGAVFVNAARVINADILVAGGVVHVIDSVLNPEKPSADPEPTLTTATPQFPYSQVSTVPFTSGQATETSVLSELSASTSNVVANYPTPSSVTGTGSMSMPPTGTSSPIPTNGASKESVDFMYALALGGIVMAAMV